MSEMRTKRVRVNDKAEEQSEEESEEQSEEQSEGSDSEETLEDTIYGKRRRPREQNTYKTRFCFSPLSFVGL